MTSIKGAIVHHTVNSNTYASDDVPGLLRGIYAYHVTGNGWCDVGYNFFVDRFGRLFEGRSGGTFKNVVGAQAQGFNSQSFGVSSLGNHDPVDRRVPRRRPRPCWPPSGSSSAGRPGSTAGTRPTSVSYTSAGGSRWPEGTVVTKPRVSGHRDFNLTSCPGDLMYDRLSSVRSTAASTYKAGVADAVTEAAAAPVVETCAAAGRHARTRCRAAASATARA